MFAKRRKTFHGKSSWGVLEIFRVGNLKGVIGNLDNLCILCHIQIYTFCFVLSRLACKLLRIWKMIPMYALLSLLLIYCSKNKIWWHTWIQKCEALFFSCCLCVWVCPALAFSNRVLHLFLFLIRIRPDWTMGTQLNFFLFSFWILLTLSHPGTKQSVSDTHRKRYMYLWDSSAAPFSRNTKKTDLSESFICLLSAHRHDCHTNWTCGLVSLFEHKCPRLYEFTVSLIIEVCVVCSGVNQWTIHACL